MFSSCFSCLIPLLFLVKLRRDLPTCLPAYIPTYLPTYTYLPANVERFRQCMRTLRRAATLRVLWQ